MKTFPDLSAAASNLAAASLPRPVRKRRAKLKAAQNAPTAPTMGLGGVGFPMPLSRFLLSTET